MNFVTQILTIRSELKKGLAIFLGNFFILSVFAQTDFPNKAVKLIVPGVSGSTSDIVARVIAKQLIEQTTKTFSLRKSFLHAGKTKNAAIITIKIYLYFFMVLLINEV